MEDNLRTASLYINNQLLSRGLLRNGQTIDFARPEKGDGGAEATMGRIMSVVNDLILRRDRDAEQRENFSSSLRAVRADSLRQTTELERLGMKHAEVQRKLGIAEATERAQKNQLKSSEQVARGLREEMARMRILVAQTRSQCANDVRKRERTIEGMKKHVGEGGRARGSGKAVGVATINVVPGKGLEGTSGGSLGVDDTGYDLRSETNEFLTELARGLSEENESLSGLLRRTVDTLRTLSGCEKEDIQPGMVIQMESGYETLAAEMECVIDHVRNLLTNPSFVPLEEVEVREEEIIRLREGWEKMETRWKEAVQMMNGWRRRMARSGQTVNLEELKAGLELSPLKTKEAEESRAFELSTVAEEGDTQADIDAMDQAELESSAEQDQEGEEFSDSDSSLFEEVEEEQEDDGFEEQSVEEQQQEHEFSLNSTSSISPGPPPQLSPLRETSTKINQGSPEQDRYRGFTTIVEENTWDLLQLDASSPARKVSPQPRQTKENRQVATSPSEDEVSLLKTSANVQIRSPRRRPSAQESSRDHPQSTPKSRPTPTSHLASASRPASIRHVSGGSSVSSRLPRPRDQPPQQSPLTIASIAAKLAATEREADAARVRAKLKAAKLARGNPSTASVSEATKLMPPPPRRDDRELEPLKGNASPGVAEDPRAAKKRKATSRPQGGGRASRRRSTLSPWELESLISGTASPTKEA